MNHALLRLLGAVALGALFGLISSAANNTTETPITFVLNSGWAWAAAPVWGGALQRSKVAAAICGPLVGFAAVFGYYGADSVFHRTAFANAWFDVTIWLVGYALVGSAFGLVGYLARSQRFAGLVARCFVPLGAFAEMIFLPRWPVVDAGPNLHAAQWIVWVAATVALLAWIAQYVARIRAKRRTEAAGTRDLLR